MRWAEASVYIAFMILVGFMFSKCSSCAMQEDRQAFEAKQKSLGDK